MKKGKALQNTLNPKNARAVVPKQSGQVVAKQSGQVVAKQSGLVRQTGEFRKLKPAENYDVISFARAMNDDFAPQLKRLFDPETDAAQQAMRTGIYIGWRCPEFKHDCQRVGSHSMCFCGHLLEQHESYTSKSMQVKCQQAGCICKSFAWIPSRAEEVGEFWLRKRPTFDATSWRAKCRCKHTHEEHRADSFKCKIKGCSCFRFDSNFLCAACDRHWEQHSTFFESASVRRANGLPTGEDYIPFAEIPQLRDIAMSGKEATEEEYKAITAMFGGKRDPPAPPGVKALQGAPGGSGGMTRGTRPKQIMGGSAMQGGQPGQFTGGSAMRGGQPGQFMGGSAMQGGQPGQFMGGSAMQRGQPGQFMGGNAMQGGQPGQFMGGSAMQGGQPGQCTGGSAMQGGQPGQFTGGSAMQGGQYSTDARGMESGPTMNGRDTTPHGPHQQAGYR